MQKKKMSIVATLSTVTMALTITFAKSGISPFLKAANNQANVEYEISLNNSNSKLSFDEGGNWDNPKPTNTAFTRKTSNGNDIVFRHSGGRSLTSVDNNFCIARNSNGWIANETALTGITKVEIQCQAGQSFRFDFSFTNALNTYSYNAESAPTYVDYRTDILTGSSTYTITPASEGYCFFRFQQISEGNNWIHHINIYYSCVAVHNHTWVHHDATPEYHNHNGSIEYEECSSCGELRNASHQTISQSDIVKQPRIYYLEKGATDLDSAVSVTNGISLDFKFEDPNGSILLMLYSSGWEEGFGAHDMKISGAGLSSCTLPGNGVTYSKMLDGWIRVTFDLSSINTYWSTSGVRLSDCAVLYLQDKAGTTTNVWCEVNSKATNFARGKEFDPVNGLTIDFDHQLVINSIVTVDLFITSAAETRTTWMIGNWTTHYGYWNFYMDRSEPASIAGVSRTQLSDGYVRYTFDMAVISENVGEQYDLKLFYIRGNNWSTASGYVEVSFVENLDSPVVEDIY